MEILVIAFLIFLNGLFSLAEIALISARKSKLEADSSAGSKMAAAALDMAEKPERFLSTVQIGITLIGILTGLYSGDILARDIGVWLSKVTDAGPYGLIAAKVVIIIVVTYFTILLGELVPKRIAMAAPETCAKYAAKPMRFISRIVSPFVWLLSKSTALIFGLLRIDDTQNIVAEDEIKLLLEEGVGGGEIEETEQDIVERVFSLGDRTVSSIMTHRSDIVWLDANKSNKETKETILARMHEVYPVGKDSLEHLIGVVNLKDLFSNFEAAEFNWNKIVKKPHFFHESASVYDALDYMKSNRLTYGLVSDEFGDLQGIINLKDILEALVGLMPSSGEDQDIVMRYDGSWLVSGQCPFYDFLSHFKMDDLYQDNHYNTLSGMIIKHLGHIPKTGEHFVWQNLKIEIADMDHLRIDKVIITDLRLLNEAAPKQTDGQLKN